VGDDAINGGLYRGSYAVVGWRAIGRAGATIDIPGDPPSPITIMHHLLGILKTLETKNNTP
jgi:Ni,Fe-hydrogenase III small subunit